MGYPGKVRQRIEAKDFVLFCTGVRPFLRKKTPARVILQVFRSIVSIQGCLVLSYGVL